MDILKRLDEEHTTALDLIPPELLDVANIEGARRAFAAVFAAMTADVPAIEGVTHDDHHIPGVEGDPDVLVRVWNRSANLAAWSAYLGDSAGGADVSEYAAPTRATDLSGLPPAYIAVGEVDLFLDEDIEYAQRLLQAGVPTELHVYPGAFHGSDTILTTSPISKRWRADRNQALGRAFGRVT